MFSVYLIYKVYAGDVYCVEAACRFHHRQQTSQRNRGATRQRKAKHIHRTPDQVRAQSFQGDRRLVAGNTHYISTPKICGTCAYRKSPVCLSMRLVRACSRITHNPDQISASTLNTLIQEVDALRRRKYKCSKEPNAWTHLVDRACAFWQPKERS